MSRKGPKAGSWEEIVTMLRLLSKYRTGEDSMRPEELVTQIDLLRHHCDEVATLISNTFDEAGEADTDSLHLDEAVRDLSAFDARIVSACEHVLMYLGSRTYQAQKEQATTKPFPSGRNA